MMTVFVKVNGNWKAFATVPAKHVDTYVKYAISRGYFDVTVV